MFEQTEFRIVGESVWHPIADVERVDLPPELYLRDFLHLDMTSLNDVLRFCRRYGRIDDPFGRTLPLAVHILPEMSPKAMDEWLAQEAARRGKPFAPDPPVPDAPPVDIVPLEDVARYQASLSNMVLLWRHLSGHIDVAEMRDGWLAAGGPVPSAITNERLVHHLAEYLDPALSAFRVRVRNPQRDPFATTPLTTYEAMCLQFTNHIAEDVPYRSCEAEGCGNLFVRTEGYARYGQNRLRGNKYCSQRCANRQAQRDYRRRKRDAASPGPSRKSGRS